MCPSRNNLLIPTASLLLLLAAGSRSELFGQNLVANGQFDGDLSFWSRVSGIGSATWDPLDANGSPHSGSVLISNDSVPEGLDTSIDQCVDITGGITHSFSADIHPDNFTPARPLQPLHTGFIYALLNFYSSPSCGGVPSNDFVVLAAQGINEWQSLGQVFKPAPSVVSALVTLSIFKQQSAGNLSGHFDSIILVSFGAPLPSSTPIPATPTPTPTPTPTATRTPTATPPPGPTSHRSPRVVPFR